MKTHPGVASRADAGMALPPIAGIGGDMRPVMQIEMIANLRSKWLGARRGPVLLQGLVHVVPQESDEFRNLPGLAVPAKMRAKRPVFLRDQAEPRRQHQAGRHAEAPGQPQGETQSLRRLKRRRIVQILIAPPHECPAGPVFPATNSAPRTATLPRHNRPEAKVRRYWKSPTVKADIVFFSRTGNTRVVVEEIFQALVKSSNVNLIEIKAKTNYPYFIWLLLSFSAQFWG